MDCGVSLEHLKYWSISQCCVISQVISSLVYIKREDGKKTINPEIVSQRLATGRGERESQIKNIRMGFSDKVGKN